VAADAVELSVEAAEEPPAVAGPGDGEEIARKRRGIRLKQDLK